MIDGLQLQSTGTDEPLLLNDAKQWLRVPLAVTVEDTNIQTLIDSCIREIEDTTRVAFVQRQWLQVLDNFPIDVLQLAWWPIRSLDVFTYYDGGGNLQTLNSSQYQFDAVRGFIAPPPNQVWPLVQLGRLAPLSLKYTVGHTDITRPASFLTTLRMLITHRYVNRQEMGIGELPMGIKDAIVSLKRGNYPG